jgi:hypothetical protein
MYLKNIWLFFFTFVIHYGGDLGLWESITVTLPMKQKCTYLYKHRSQTVFISNMVLLSNVNLFPHDRFVFPQSAKIQRCIIYTNFYRSYDLKLHLKTPIFTIYHKILSNTKSSNKRPRGHIAHLSHIG